MHVFWLVNFILLLIAIYTSAVKLIKDWESKKMRRGPSAPTMSKKTKFGRGISSPANGR